MPCGAQELAPRGSRDDERTLSHSQCGWSAGSVMREPGQIQDPKLQLPEKHQVQAAQAPPQGQLRLVALATKAEKRRERRRIARGNEQASSIQQWKSAGWQWPEWTQKSLADNVPAGIKKALRREALDVKTAEAQADADFEEVQRRRATAGKLETEHGRPGSRAEPGYGRNDEPNDANRRGKIWKPASAAAADGALWWRPKGATSVIREAMAP